MRFVCFFDELVAGGDLSSVGHVNYGSSSEFVAHDVVLFRAKQGATLIELFVGAVEKVNLVFDWRGKKTSLIT